MNRVVVTGIGVVSALGNDAVAFWKRIVAGEPGIGPITKVDMSDFRFKNAAEACGFDAAQHFDDKNLMWLDPFAQFGIVAAREAVVDSGIEFDEDLRHRTGVITGSCLGGKETEDSMYRDLYGE